MTLVGRPNHLYMWSRYSWAMPSPVIVVSHAKKIAACEHPWSTIMRIASFPWMDGSPVIRSMATCWNGHVLGSVGMQYRETLAQCIRILFCWHMAHPLM